MCDHIFTLGGVCFVDSDRQLPGTGACARTYYRFFFCTQCLRKQHELIPSYANTYEHVLYDATPEFQRNIQLRQEG